MSEGIRAQIIGYCEAVETGSKPAALMSIQTRYEEEAVKLIKRFGLNAYTKKVIEDENWRILWIYKEPYLLEIIKMASRYPTSIYEHWLLGKLFGYSEEAIKKFLTDNYFL